LNGFIDFLGVRAKEDHIINIEEDDKAPFVKDAFVYFRLFVF